MEITNNDFDADVLYTNLDKVFTNVACRKFSGAGIIVDNNVKYNIIYEGIRCVIFSCDGTICVDNNRKILGEGNENKSLHRRNTKDEC